MLIGGRKVCYRVKDQGVFHCQRCGGDRPYRRRAGRLWMHALRIPLLPLAGTGEHLQCAVCRTCYRIELLDVPTTAQMLIALQAGTKVAARTMLLAGDPGSTAARRLAASVIGEAGVPDYDEICLAADLAGPGDDGAGDPELALRILTTQLEIHAREWFLANVVRIGLADGPLTGPERQTVRTIARYLGMTQAQAQDVIWLTEEAAAAG